MENYLTLLVKDASGNGVEDPLFLKMTGFRKTTIYPAGLFADAQFILPRDILTRPSMLSAGFEVTIVSGGMVVYHGWVDGLDDVSNTSAEGTRVSCVGDWAKYMERRGLERRWADMDLSESTWSVNTAASGAELATVDRRDRVRMTPKAEAWSNSDTFQLDYQTPTGELIGKITLDYELAEGAQAWELALFNGVADEFSITTSSTGSQNVDLGTSTAQLRLIANAGQTPTSDGTYFGQVSNVVVYAGRDHASGTLGNVDIYEISLDIVDRLGVDETSISADTSDLDSSLTFSLVPFVSNGYETYGSQLARAAGYGDSSQNSIGFGFRPPHYAPDNLPRLFVEPYPALTDYDYEASSDEVGLSVRLNLDDVWNYIIVEYQDGENWLLKVTPADDSTLTDTDSVAQYGKREKVLRIGDSDTTTATNYGVRFLNRHKQPTYAVTKPLRVSRLRAKNGGWVSAMHINAGKRVRFNDLPNRIAQASPTGTTFLITKSDYDHESGIATLSIGGVPDDLAILLAQEELLGGGGGRAGAGGSRSGSATDQNAIHDNVASEISAIANKANPTDADYLLIEDAAATNAKKHITIANLFEGSNPDFVRLEEQGSAPSTPASGYGALYGKTDGQLYWKNDAGAETNLTWGTSATWTPQLTQNTSVLTTTVTGNYYILTGKLCIAHARIAYVSGTTANQPIGIGNLPATPATNDIVIGSMVVFDSGTAFYHGAMRWVSVDSKAYAIGHNQGNWIGISPAFSLASGDWVNIQLCYITA